MKKCSAQKQINQVRLWRQAWRWRCILALTGAVLLPGVLASTVSSHFFWNFSWNFSGEAHANPVRTAIRVRDELYQPLVPVTKNFKTCFKFGPDGSPMVTLCESEEPTPPTTTAPSAPRAPATPRQIRPTRNPQTSR